MIETEQTVTIGRGIEDVWTHVRDIERWASLMPGLRECRIVDVDNSSWVLKVGAGGLVRTVHVNVHVDAWDGPERVAFTYDLDGDPVQGAGTYCARSLGPTETEVTLHVQVIGGGQMAMMWEAMGKPLLPQFARTFAQQLKAEIEAPAADAGPETMIETPARPSMLARLLRLIGKLFGRPAAIEREGMS